MTLAGKAKRNAYAGFFCWFLILFLQLDVYYAFDLIEKVVLFGVLVVVPLGLAIVEIPGFKDPKFYWWSVFLQPFSAVAAAWSLFIDKGVEAAILASFTLLLHIVIALLGLSRILDRGLLPIHEFSIDAGLIYLPVAGFWFVVYRLGIQPFDFSETIILLTVVHFHFAGFATPIIAGLVARFLASDTRFRAPLTLSILAIITSMPLVAFGISLAPLVALFGAILLTVGTTILGIITLGWVQRMMPSPLSRLALIISAVANLAAMVMACLYAYSIVTKILIFDIPKMARFHGLLNAFGFVACSLIVWSSVQISEPKTPGTFVTAKGSNL